MQSGGKHHPGCERAIQHKCVCECNGIHHGWQSRLEYIREPSGNAREAFKENANQRWVDAHTGQTRRRPSKRKKAAATDIAESDIMDWMANDLSRAPREERSSSIGGPPRDTADQVVESVGNIVANKVSRELEGRLAPMSREHRAQITSHLWCDLLAAIACGIKKLQNQLNKVPTYATAAIIASRRTENRAIDEFLIRLAVHTAWNSLLKLSPIPGQINELLRATRILAIFICPAPEDHKEVATCCLDPLAKNGAEGLIKEATRRKLIEVLPPEWLPSS